MVNHLRIESRGSNQTGAQRTQGQRYKLTVCAYDGTKTVYSYNAATFHDRKLQKEGSNGTESAIKLGQPGCATGLQTSQVMFFTAPSSVPSLKYSV